MLGHLAELGQKRRVAEGPCRRCVGSAEGRRGDGDGDGGVGRRGVDARCQREREAQDMAGHHSSPLVLAAGRLLGNERRAVMRAGVTEGAHKRVCGKCGRGVRACTARDGSWQGRGVPANVRLEDWICA